MTAVGLVASLDHVEIAIVGAGPRGVSLLERIGANVAVDPPGVPVSVHLIDPYPPGPGQVWRTDQAGSLLMNTVASQVTLFTDPTVETERLAIVERAKARGVFGVPYFLAGDRAFFGNDRLPLLSFHLMTMPPPDLLKPIGTAKVAEHYVEAMRIATHLASGPRQSYMVTRHGHEYARLHTTSEVLWWEAEEEERMTHTKDMQEGVAAFLAKRTPNFVGE